MKIFTSLSIVALSFCMVTQAFGEDALKEAKPSPWMDNRVRFKLEETLYFLMQANHRAKELPKEYR